MARLVGFGVAVAAVTVLKFGFIVAADIGGFAVIGEVVITTLVGVTAVMIPLAVDEGIFVEEPVDGAAVVARVPPVGIGLVVSELSIWCGLGMYVIPFEG